MPERITHEVIRTVAERVADLLPDIVPRRAWSELGINEAGVMEAIVSAVLGQFFSVHPPRVGTVKRSDDGQLAMKIASITGTKWVCVRPTGSVENHNDDDLFADWPIVHVGKEC